MKTLDEVIKAFEICDETVTANCPDCPYDIDCENVPGEDLRTDALHYLKEYKDKSHWLDIQISDHVRAFEQWSIEMARLKENSPLTWDELKGMVGKPVWIEEHWAPMEDEAGVTEDEGDIDAYWAILTYSDEKRISVVNGSVDQWLHKNLWNNHNVSHSWTAYRKERP